jgi:hypothetical protein
MRKAALILAQLHAIRNCFGKTEAAQKLSLLRQLAKEKISSGKLIHEYYNLLLFLATYPDNPTVYKTALSSLAAMENYLQQKQALRDRLFNSGLAHTSLCSSFSFEIVKWLCTTNRSCIRFDSFDADDGQVASILTVVLPRAESEIFQDANESWRSWLLQNLKSGEDLLDRLVAVFDQAIIRADIRDALWGSLGINTVINIPTHPRLPYCLVKPFYHRSLYRKAKIRVNPLPQPIAVKLTSEEAAAIIDCARTVLLQHLREIDPITFTSPDYISVYRLPRGLTVALMGMKPGRRSPVDCYMGYMVFKNGFPVSYAGSWILFDSGRIGLNIFPAYRGGESKFIFEQLLKIHAAVYRLKRFTVDPYQVGKENKDGIQSGAFWIYYDAGFRPLKKMQLQLAEEEAAKRKAIPHYRTPGPLLKKLADARMELILEGRPVRFDATDITRVFSAILQRDYHNDRQKAISATLPRMARLLGIKNYDDLKVYALLTNWCVWLAGIEKYPSFNRTTKKELRHLFRLKSRGNEEAYMQGLRHASVLRSYIEWQMVKYLIEEGGE